jgi:hypothetical protein
MARSTLGALRLLSSPWAVPAGMALIGALGCTQNPGADIATEGIAVQRQDLPAESLLGRTSTGPYNDFNNNRRRDDEDTLVVADGTAFRSVTT